MIRSSLQGKASEGSSAIPSRPAPRAGGIGPGAATALNSADAFRVLRTPGRPLEAGFRRSMETRFRHDFGAVRVHAGPEAVRSAQAMGAAAFTSGAQIVLGRGGAAPPEARRDLLVHELTHVVQQSGGGAGASAVSLASRAGPEQEARANARAAAGQGTLTVRHSAPTESIQCQEGKEGKKKKGPEGKFSASRGGGPSKGKAANSFGFEGTYTVPLDPGVSFGAVTLLDKFELKGKGSSSSEEPLLDTTELQKLQLDLSLRLAQLELKKKLGKMKTPGELTLGAGVTSTGGLGFGFGPEPSRTGSLGVKTNLDVGIKTPSLLPDSAGKLTLGLGVGGEAAASQSLGDDKKATSSLGAKGKVDVAYESPPILGGPRIKVGGEVGAGTEWKHQTGEDPGLASKLSAGGSVTLQGKGIGPLAGPFAQVKVTGEATLDEDHRRIDRSNSSVTVMGTVGFQFGGGRASRRRRRQERRDRYR